VFGAVLFIVLIVIVGQTIAKANRNFNRNKPKVRRARVRTSPTGVPAAPGNAAVYRPGDSATYRPGDSATYRPGDSATYKPGDSPTFRPGDSPTYQPGDSATYQPGDSPTYKPGDSATYRPGNAPTYQPGNATTEPPPMAPPPSSRGRRPGRTPTQPAYATRTEQQTARRNQAVIDRDARETARTEPTQAPYQGSTAISSTSLNTSLVMPYQPTSLMSSLSSSLSSSLFDTGPRRETSAAFGSVVVVSLPSDVEEQVRVFMGRGSEVEAVQLVVDKMDVGILEATKTVRGYVDDPA
jgi:hypothetical protein